MSSSNLRRTNLFNRRFALSRKAVLALPADRDAIRRDSEGFDDLDDYFAAKTPSWPQADGEQSPEHADAEADAQARLEEFVHDRQSEIEILENIEPLNEENILFADEVSFAKTIRLSPSKTVYPAFVPAPAPVSMPAPAPAPALVRASASVSSTENGKKRTKTAVSGCGERKKRSRMDRLVSVAETPMADGDGDARKSRRNRIAPLAFWRNEKVVYGRRLSSRMPVIVDVLRKDEEKSPTKQRARAGRKPTAGEREQRKARGEAALKRAGFRAQTNVSARVMDYDSHQETERLLALSPDQLQPNTVNGENFQIQTVFTEGNFLSSGVLVFPPASVKPTRNSSKHALVFYVVEGSVEVTVHKTAFVVGTGGQFIVPRGNQYSIKSVWSNASRLFFCHCKDNAED